MATSVTGAAATTWVIPGASETDRQSNNGVLLRRMRAEDELFAAGLTPGSRAWKNRMLQLNLRETGALSPVGFELEAAEEQRRRELITNDNRLAEIQHLLWQERLRVGVDRPRNEITVQYENRTYTYNDDGGIREATSTATTETATVEVRNAPPPPEPEPPTESVTQPPEGFQPEAAAVTIEADAPVAIPEAPTFFEAPAIAAAFEPPSFEAPVVVVTVEPPSLCERVLERFYDFEASTWSEVAMKVMIWALSLTGIFVIALFLYEYCCPLRDYEPA